MFFFFNEKPHLECGFSFFWQKEKAERQQRITSPQ